MAQGLCCAPLPALLLPARSELSRRAGCRPQQAGSLQRSKEEDLGFFISSPSYLVPPPPASAQAPLSRRRSCSPPPAPPPALLFTLKAWISTRLVTQWLMKLNGSFFWPGMAHPQGAKVSPCAFEKTGGRKTKKKRKRFSWPQEGAGGAPAGRGQGGSRGGGQSSQGRRGGGAEAGRGGGRSSGGGSSSAAAGAARPASQVGGRQGGCTFLWRFIFYNAKQQKRQKNIKQERTWLARRGMLQPTSLAAMHCGRGGSWVGAAGQVVG